MLASALTQTLSSLTNLLGLRYGQTESLRNIATIITQQLADGCIISLFEPEQQTAVIQTATHRLPAAQEALRLLDGHQIDLSKACGLSIAIREGRIYHQTRPCSASASDNDLPLMSDNYRHFEFGYYAIPLRQTDQIIGALGLLFPDGALLPLLPNAHLLGELVSAIIRVARFSEEAKKALRIKNEFISIASHELKTPLTSLSLCLQLLDRLTQAQAKPEASQASDIVKDANHQMHRIERLINDLLDLSRISRGGLLLNTETFDLSAAVSEAVDNSLKAKAHSIPVNIQIEPEITGEWDRFRIEQIIQNLLSNAVKYGDGKPIDISLRIKGAFAEISVRDRGRGICTGDQKKIFELFERGRNDAHISGLGIGLYVVKELVRMHGGVVQVQSTPGAGSTFIVRLPLLPAIDVAEAIQVHLRWKKRITDHMEGGSLEELSPEQIRPDNLCTLGNWIYRILARSPDNQELEELRDIHKSFHAVAATVIETFETSGRSAAERLLAPDSEYAVMSKEIIARLERLHRPR